LRKFRLYAECHYAGCRGAILKHLNILIINELSEAVEQLKLNSSLILTGQMLSDAKQSQRN